MHIENWVLVNKMVLWKQFLFLDTDLTFSFHFDASTGFYGSSATFGTWCGHLDDSWLGCVYSTAAVMLHSLMAIFDCTSTGGILPLTNQLYLSTNIEHWWLSSMNLLLSTIHHVLIVVPKTMKTIFTSAFILSI